MRTKKGRSFLGNALTLWVLILVITSCQQSTPSGFLTVLSGKSGTYEIYRIESESPFQYVSEQIGYFNQKLPLAPGQYLILSDCSSKIIIVQPNTSQEIVSHRVIFQPPIATLPTSKFSVQCDRHDRTRSRQHFTNKYTFNILEGQRDLLVGMVPLAIDLISSGVSSQTLTYRLSGIKVEKFPGMKPKTKFFVSPLNGIIAITEPQDFGTWQFFLPGTYTVEVNGTHLKVDLSMDEKKMISPAFLQVKSSNLANLDLSSQIRGSPIFVELNDHHWMELNETYPVLPGKATIKLNGSQVNHSIDLVSGKSTILQASSLIVHYDCSPWEWTCLGGRQIYLYEDDKPYPFAKGVTDVPILYLNTDVSISIEGSRDIRFQLPKKTHIELSIGKIRFIPKPVYRPGQMTDLVRVEAHSPATSGHTLDIQFDRITTMPLIIGPYEFAQYISSTNLDGQRHRTVKIVNVHKNQILDVDFHIITSEKKTVALRKALKEQKISEFSKIYRNGRDFIPALSTQFN